MRAFTLLEMLVYIALLSVMTTGILSTLAALNASLSNARTEVIHLGEYLLARDMADQGIHQFSESP